MAALKATGAKRVLDLGCGEGKLLRELLKEKQFEEIVGMDVAVRSLEIAKDRLRLDDLPARQKDRIRLLHGSLMYRDKRLAGFDAAAVVEVVEHLDPPRLAAFERVVFEFARPATVVLTTPNREYNVDVAEPRCRGVSARGPPIRVDSGGVSGLGDGLGREVRLHGRVPGGGAGTRRPRIADADGSVSEGRRPTMGSSHDEFVKYPRTPHLFGSKGTDDDKHLSEAESQPLHRRRVADRGGEDRRHERRHSLHPGRADGPPMPGASDHRGNAPAVRLVQAMDGREAARPGGTAGRSLHPVRRMGVCPAFGPLPAASALLLRVRHLRQGEEAFLSLELRLALLDGTESKPCPSCIEGHRRETSLGTDRPFAFRQPISRTPSTKRADNLMEGLYLRTEADGAVTGRAKFVRPEFVEKVKQSTHWQHQAMVPNLLKEGADIWS